MHHPLLPILLLLSGCCAEPAPAWSTLDPLVIEPGHTATLDLAAYVQGSPTLTADNTADILASVNGTSLEVAPQPDYEGQATLTLTATNACGATATTTLDIIVGDAPDTGDTASPARDCATALTYTARGSPDAVAMAGTFNDWATDTHRLTDNGDGTWTIALDLDEGAYPYKIVEIDEGAFDDTEHWTCDPDAALIQCDAGYTTPGSTDWSQDCALDGGGCNSLLVVPDCRAPSLTLNSLQIDRERRAVRVSVAATEGKDGATLEPLVTLDGVQIEGWDGEGFEISLSALSATRHSLRFELSDADGNEAEPLVIPFWLDDFDWDSAVLYYAFVDRLADGDTGLNGAEGATALTGEYMGGDWQGLLDLLPYLDDLGVTALWLSNPQDNVDGAWDGQCDATYTGYHGYWPISGDELEPHMGDEASLHAVIDAAHALGMRVLIDWVANHVHEDHPYYQDHPDWFADYAWCEDDDNWNTIPETCWFAPYLPDVDYYNPEPLTRFVDDAVDLARDYDLDGLRVDAAKHMPHSVQWNLNSRIEQALEHKAAGGDEDFWTVGETFDGYDRIDDYIDEHQLDGQFDFPLYYAIRATFIDESTSLPDLVSSASAAQLRFADARMGTFLGNHDVTRFVTAGTESDTSACDSDGVRQADPPWDTSVYGKLKLAWTFLFTQPGVPLVYYGDELGLPGYADPDNRQPLWWYTGDISGGRVADVDDVASRVDSDEADVLQHVAALSRARAAHSSLWRGDQIEWWTETDLYAYARTDGEDASLTLINRSDADRTLSNGLAFAGLPTSGTYTDALTGDSFTPSSGTLSVDIGAGTSRVLLWSP